MVGRELVTFLGRRDIRHARLFLAVDKGTIGNWYPAEITRIMLLILLYCELI
jgi:hypothetical protein